MDSFMNTQVGGKVELRGEVQMRMVNKLKAKGLIGLTDMLIGMARTHDDGKIASWKKFLAFAEEDENWVYFYLSSLDPEFLEALLQGTVWSRCEEDEGFRRIVRTKQELRNTPQVYGNALTRVQSSRINNTQDARDLAPLERRGTGGSPKLMLEALELGWRYLQVRDRRTDELAKEIDGMMPQRQLGTTSPYGRKYIPTVASLERLTDWFKASMRTLNAALKQMDEEERNKDVEWTFVEAGFGVSGSSRGPNHVWHTGTNYLFGLVTASMMHPRRNDFEIRTFVIFHVMKPEHADPCEVLGSLLAGSYGRKGWDGIHGLNPVLAGGAVMDPNSKRAINQASYDQMWEFNRSKALERFDNTFSKSKIWDNDRLDREEELHRLPSKISDLEAEVERRKVKLEETRVWLQAEKDMAKNFAPKRQPGILELARKMRRLESSAIGPLPLRGVAPSRLIQQRDEEASAAGGSQTSRLDRLGSGELVEGEVFPSIEDDVKEDLA